MEIKTTKFSQLDGLELKEATFQNHVFPDHFHDAYSIGIIERGIERVSFTGKHILAHANSVIVINPYEIHANSYFDHDSWKYRIIYINSEVMKYVQTNNGLFCNKTIWFPQSVIDDPCLYQLILHLHGDSKINKISDVYTMLVYLVRNYASEKQENGLSGYLNEIEEIVGFIQRQLYDKIVLEQLATKCNMDKYKFIRVFKKHTGLTPGSYLLLQRINKAKTLIAANMSITEVALETGFYDQSHFIHCFKKYIGVAPLSYKRGIFME